LGIEEPEKDAESSIGEAGTKNDPWYWYRVAAGVLTAFTGISAAMLVLSVALAFMALGTLFSLPSMGSSMPSGWNEFGPGTILFALLAFGFFAAHGYRFSRDGTKGRVPLWIASILGLPLGIYSIWILIMTAPGSCHVPPDPRLAKRLVAGGAVVVAVWALITVVPNLRYTLYTWQENRAAREASSDNAFFEVLTDFRRTDELRVMLAEGADPNQTTKLGATALMVAMIDGSEYHAQLLLEHGADPNMPSRFQRDEEEIARIHRNVNNYDPDHALRLLANSFRKHTPLVVAADRGQSELVAALLEAGADVNARQNWNEDGIPQEIIPQGLREKARGTSLSDPYGGPGYRGWPAREPSALEEMINAGDGPGAELLLERGATVDPDIFAKVTPELFRRSYWRGAPLVKALLERGAKPSPSQPDEPRTFRSSAYNWQPYLPLLKAVQNNNVHAVRSLLQHGADPGEKLDGYSPAEWLKVMHPEESKRPGSLYSMLQEAKRGAAE
jgi:ankyrin repeat protein